MKKKLAFIALVIVVLFSVPLKALPAVLDNPKSSSVYFSPKGGIRDKIISKINLSRKSIKLAIYSFTSGDLAWALENAKKRGVEISIVADKSQAKGKSSEIPYLVSKGFSIKILQGRGRGIMHNKFAVFDDKEVVTGSYNWTDNAENNNYENAVFISDPKVVGQFSNEFDSLYR